MKTTQKNNRKQESPWSFRPDDDVKQFVNEAVETTGFDKSDIINRALRKCGEKAIAEFFAELREREQKWIQARGGAGKP